VWRAEIDGRRLRFHLTGINNQNFLMQDDETGSWWQQVTGEALFGPLKGRRLELVFHDEISFGEWRREHPRGRVLRPLEGVPWREFSQDWEAETAKLPVVTPARAGDPLPPRELVVGVRLRGAAKAYPFAALRRQSPVIDAVGGVPIVLVVGEDGRSVRAFERRLDGRELSLFARPGPPPLRLVDAETGSEWDFAGKAVSGPLAGKELPRVYVLKSYWFDWRTREPETAVYKSRGLLR
jgi:uncharacterized protein DUF3179